MKKLLLLTIAIWYLTAGCYSQTDWKSFMSRQDMTSTSRRQRQMCIRDRETAAWVPISAKNPKKTPYG